MTEQKFVQLCKKYILAEFYDGKIKEDEIYVVWLCKILQNNKALASTTVPDGMYYEVTYNGDKGELYLDAYKKWENVMVRVHNLQD